MLIPSPPIDFCGRHREIDKLMELFSSQRVIIIAGLAGIGKTALASSFIERINKSDYSANGIIWISCQEGWEYRDLLAEINSKANELLTHEEMTESLESLEHIIDFVEKHKFYLIIDDFHLVENEKTRKIILLAKDFFKNSKLIITSRRRVKLDPVDRMDILERRLDGLTSKDSNEMIKRLIELHGIGPLSDEDIKQIYYKVKGHPLLIKLFVSLLTSGGYKLSSLLNTASQFEEEMEHFLFDRMWGGLNSLERKALKMLAIPRISLDPEKYPFIKDKKTFKSLKDRFLIDNNQDGKISVHSLLRNYAISKFKEDELLRSRVKIAEHFLKAKKPNIIELKEACYLFELSGMIKKAIDSVIRMGDFFLILGEEIDYFLQLVNDAIERGNGYKLEELLKYKIQVLFLMGKTDEASRLIETIKNKYDRDFLNASLYIKKGKYADSQKLFKQVLKNSLNKKDRIIALNGLGVCLSYTGSLTESEKYYKNALKELENQDFILLKARVLGNLANLLCDMGRLQDALDHYINSEDIYKSYNAIAPLGIIQYNLGFTYVELGEYDKAQRLLDESYECKEKAKDYPGIAYLFNLLASVYLKKGDTEKALEFNQKAYDTAKKYCNESVQAEILADFSDIYMQMGKLKEAERNIRLAMDRFKAFGNSFKLSQHKIINAQILFLTKKEESSIKILETVLKYASENEHSKLILECSYVLSLIYKKIGKDTDCERVLESYYKEGLKYSNEYKKELEKSFLWFKSKLEEDSGDFIILERNMKIACSIEKLEEYRNKIKQYDIFIDFPERRLLVKGEEIIFFKKRTLVPLLKILVKEPGEIISQYKLFKDVWGREYEPEFDGGTLRVSISRLRKILKEKKNDIEFIGISENGEYYFNKNSKFCIILEK